MAEENRYIISILVDNKSGVLARVVSLYGRRGFNIDSLTVSATNNQKTSRITLVFIGDQISLHQIMSQTQKLEVVQSVHLLDPHDSIYRELLLVKVAADKNERTKILEICSIFRARVLNVKKDSLIIELTGSPNKLDSFLEMLDCYKIVDVCRTGTTGVSRN